MKKLHLAEDLELPLDVVTEKLAVLGQSGGGKTHTGCKLAELMLAIGAQVIPIDIAGKWWSLKAGGERGSQGFPITVFGGRHADVALAPSAGPLVGRLLGEKAISAVLDVSLFDDEELVRFVGEFATAFYAAKTRNPSPVHLFFEEAHEIAPETPEVRGGAAALRAVTRLCKLGRNHGVGYTLVSQQPQSVSKRVLNQVGTLLAMRTTGDHERKAIAQWVTGRATSGAGADLRELLSKLQTGDAWIWSPAWLRISRQIHVAKRITFDASKTPEVGAKAAAPGKLAKTDVAAFNALIAEVEAAAASEDPTLLLRRIAELELENKKLAFTRPAPVPAPAREKRVEVQVVGAGELRRLEAGIKAIGGAGEKLQAIAAELAKKLADATRTPVAAGPGVIAMPLQRALPNAAYRAQLPPPTPRARPTPAGATGERVQLVRGARDMLAVLAHFHPQPLSRPQVALWAVLATGTGSFINRLSELRLNGMIEEIGSNVLRLSAAGSAQAAADPRDVPTTTGDLVARWQRKLPGVGKQMITVLVAAYPGTLARTELAERSGVASDTGSFINRLSELRLAGLIEEPERGTVRASANLFLGNGS